jgi:hypothetical protein
MFKIGDTVVIQHLTDKQRNHLLYVPCSMNRYEGQTGKIMNIDKVDYGQDQMQYEYEVCFQDGDKWWWLEEWIKPDIEYIPF